MVAAQSNRTEHCKRREHSEVKLGERQPSANYKCGILTTEMARPRSIDKTGKQPASKQVALRLTEAQYLRLRKRAKAKGVTVAELLRNLAKVA